MVNYEFKTLYIQKKLWKGKDSNVTIIFCGSGLYKETKLLVLLPILILCSSSSVPEKKTEMLGVFSGEVVEAPAELVTAGSRTPSPKTRGSELVNRFKRSSDVMVSVQIGSVGHLAYSQSSKSPFTSRLFAAKDDIFCLFKGVLDNLGSLRHHYGLSKCANEALLILEAYKTLRDRAPYPASFMLGQLTGNFSVIVFDKTTSTLLVASDSEGKIPLFWGITSDGCVAFCDDLDLLKGSCGKSLAPFPQGCFFLNTLGGLKSYENPKNKVTATLADEEEICGATFQVEGNVVLAATL